MKDQAPIHVLVTGAAGFIGFHVCERLLADGFRVTGIDSLEGEDLDLCRDRLAALGIGAVDAAGPVQSATSAGFTFVQADIRDAAMLGRIFSEGISHVVHLAARVGVRQSVADPRPYLEANVNGFFNLLELARKHGLKHLVFASSSSVYGLATESPFRVEQDTDHPVSFYAATKKANELFAHSYAHLHGLPVTGLRFFTVYGPWGRPDMAPYLFTRSIVDGLPIRVFNHGRLRRDFTYVGDIVEGLVRIIERPPPAGQGSGQAPFRIYNIGRGTPVDIMDFIREIENQAGKKAEIILEGHQPGDVEETFADVSGLRKDIGYQPITDLKTGLRAYWEWFKAYYLDGRNA